MISLKRFGLACVLGWAMVFSSKGVTTLTLGTTYGGTIALPGQTNLYTFNGTPGQRLFFDALDLDNITLNVTLLSPGGVQLYQNNDDYDAGPWVLSEAGVYSLVINGSGPTTGNYEFRVLDLSTAPPLTLETPFSDQLSPPLSCNIYQFAGKRGQRVTFQTLSYSTNQAQWRLVSPANVMLVSGQIAANLGPVTLPVDGPYCLMVIGTSPGITPMTYQLLASDVIDTPVAASGFGTPHSGTVSANQTNTFTYSASAGLPVYFDSLDASGQSLEVDLFDPTGAPVFVIGETSDAGPYILPVSGTYTLNVRGPGGASGNFNFRLLDLTASPVLMLNTNFSNTLAQPYQTDVYQLTGTAGQRLYYDSLATSTLGIQVHLLAPDGSRPLDGNYYYDAGPFTLQFPGTYYLFVQSSLSSSASYNFNFLDIAAQPALLLSSDLTGTLAPNSTLIYRLAGTSGETLFFYGKSVSVGGGSCYLYDQHNTPVTGANMGSDFAVSLPYDGSYAVVFTAPNSALTYSNQFSSFSYFTNALTFGTVVTNNIFNPGDQFVYTFNGTTGQRLYYDALTPYVPSINFNLISPTGVNAASGNASADVGPITLTQSGIYSLVFQGTTHATGPISFQLLDLASQPALPLNQDLTGNLAPNLTTLYQFDGTSGQQLYFNTKAVSAGGAAWYLYGPNNAVVGGAALVSDFEVTLANPGKYAVVLINGANPVAYSNQVNTFSYSTNTLTLGTPVTNNLVNPGDQLYYTFNGTAGQRIYIDGLTPNYPSIYYTLFSPGGVQVGYADVSADLGPLTLPQTGTYSLQIDGYGDVIGPVSFNVLDIAVQPSLPLNIDLAGTLPANGSTIFQLAGVSGQQLYFNSEAVTGGGASWTLYGPNNVSLNGNNLTADFEQTLPFTGTYVLVLSAANNPITYTNQVNTFGNTTNTLTLGSVIAPTIVHPGDQVIYTFSGTAGQRLYFDSRQTNFNNNIQATLFAPAGGTVFSINSYSDGGPYTLTQSGTYSLVLDGAGDSTGIAPFSLLDLAAATSATIGTTITDSLSDQTETKFYRFNGTAGQRWNLHSVSVSSAQAYWGLLGPGDLFVGPEPTINSDIGVVLLPVKGTYTLAVIGAGASLAGISYQLAVTDVSEASAAPSGFGTVNSGNLVGGQTNTYTYTASAGTPVFFDSQDASGQSLVVDLMDPTGTAVFSTGEISDTGPYILPHSGTYTLNVRGPGGASGNYSFRLLDLSTSPSLTLNNAVTATLSNPYQADIYQFTSAAGQTFYYDALTNDVNSPSVSAVLLDPRGQNVGVSGSFTTDRGPFSVRYGGTCYLIVQSPRSAPSPYSFRLLDVASQPVLPINTAVTNTLDVYPAQVYHYNGTAGTRLYFRGQPNNPSGYWNLYDPNNGSVGGAGLGGDFEVTLPYTGAYALLVSSSASAAGTQIFQVNDFSYTTNAYTVGSSVIGSITRPGERGIYTFTGTLGQQLIYDALTNDPPNGDVISATLLNPQGVQEGPLNSRMSSDRGPFTLQQSGTYTVVIDGSVAGMGPFAFRLLDVSAQPSLPINTVVTNTLDVYPLQVYRYAGTAGQRLYFQGQPSNPGGFWTLFDPNNAIVTAGSAGLGSDFEVTLPLSGTYTLLLTSYSSSASPEAFQVNDYSYFTNAYTIGNTVVDTITRPGEQRFYSFTGTVGQHLIYDAVTNDTPAPNVISVSLVNPQGLTEAFGGTRFFNDQGPFTLQQSGTYTLVFDGYISSIGTFAFRLLDVATQPVLPVGLAVTNTLDAYPLQVYRYEGTNGQHLYFKGFSGNASGSWRIYDPNNNQVNGGGGSLTSDFQVVLPLTGTYAVTITSYGTTSTPEVFQVNSFNNGEPLVINRAPVLNHIGPQVLGAGLPVTFTAQASDPDGNSLTFSLDLGAPAGAAINPGTGAFSWNPPITGLSSVTPVTVRVTDNGNPSLSDAETVSIEVIAGPSMITVQRVGSVANVYFHSAPTKHYRMQYKTNVIDASWQRLGSDITAIDLITIQPDPTIGTNDHRFYRVQALDPLP